MFAFLVSSKHFEEKRFCWKVYKIVHHFGLWAEERFILRKKLRARSVIRAFSVSWETVGWENFLEKLIDLSIISELCDEKLKYSDFFPSEMWKLQFSCPGKVFKEKYLAWKTVLLIFFRVWTAKNSDFSKITSRGLSELSFACPGWTIWRKNFLLDLIFFRSS